jgi:hypothetical protein
MPWASPTDLGARRRGRDEDPTTALSAPVARMLNAWTACGRRRAGSARCPARDDHKPSLSIREGRDGRRLVHCFAGCSPEAITQRWT